MQTLTVSLTDNGELTFLVGSNDLGTVFAEQFKEIPLRASYVEPCNIFLRALFHTLRKVFGEGSKVGQLARQLPCNWRINLAPIGGKVLSGVYSVREKAIAAEVDYLERNFI